MKRRSFLQILTGALFAPVPAVVSARQSESVRHAFPGTVKALQAGCFTLFADVRDMEPRAYQDFRIDAVETGSYRMMPVVWREEGASESELVALAWLHLQDVARVLPRSILWWRVRPTIEPYRSFTSDRPVLRLRMRYGVMSEYWAKLWQETRARTVYVPIKSWREWKGI